MAWHQDSDCGWGTTGSGNVSHGGGTRVQYIFGVVEQMGEGVQQSPRCSEQKATKVAEEGKLLIIQQKKKGEGGKRGNGGLASERVGENRFARTKGGARWAWRKTEEEGGPCATSTKKQRNRGQGWRDHVGKETRSGGANLLSGSPTWGVGDSTEMLRKRAEPLGKESVEGELSPQPKTSEGTAAPYGAD